MPRSASSLGEEPGLQADQELVDRGWLRIGAGVAVAAQAMVFSLAVNLSEISGWAYVVVHGILILSALLALVFLGKDLTCSAWSSMRERRISIDLLFLLTLLGALAGSLVSTFTRVGSVYYEVVAILIVVHTAGKMLGARSRVAALRAVEQTRERFETCRMVMADGSVIMAKVSAVKPAAQVMVAPGEAIAVDGVVLSGRGYVQETSMTGEWRPGAKAPGDRVLAGTFSIDGTFAIEAEGGRRRLDDVLETVQSARLAPSRLQQQADRLMAWFLPVVAAVSVGTFGGWWWIGSWERALFNCMAVLLVACPCAMGLATPVAVWNGLVHMAGFGLTARTGDIVDLLGRADVFLIDKTGTLSEGALSVRAWRIDPPFQDKSDWLRAVAARAESGLSHPVALAFQNSRKAEDGGVSAGEWLLEKREIVPACGIVATLRAADGERHEIAIGERELAARFKSGLPSEDWADDGADSSDGKRVHVFVDGSHAASVLLGEKWRTGLDDGLAGLRELGVDVEILSGDPRARAQFGPRIVVRPGLSPARKRERVEALKRAGRVVLFVGDGLNDAAAMSEAHGAIVMRGGASLARASAMAVFAGEDLGFLPKAVRYARAVRTAVRFNLYFAVGYNVAGMTLAATGHLHPVAAALLMVGSSAFVSIFALRMTNRAAVSCAGR